MTLFKHYKLRKYSLKKLNITISDALNTQTSIKTYPFKVLKECPEHSLVFPYYNILY